MLSWAFFRKLQVGERNMDTERKRVVTFLEAIREPPAQSYRLVANVRCALLPNLPICVWKQAQVDWKSRACWNRLRVTSGVLDPVQSY